MRLVRTRPQLRQGVRKSRGYSAAWNPEEGLWCWLRASCALHAHTARGSGERMDSHASSRKRDLCFFTDVKPGQWHWFWSCSFRYWLRAESPAHTWGPSKAVQNKRRVGESEGERQRSMEMFIMYILGLMMFPAPLSHCSGWECATWSEGSMLLSVPFSRP